MYNSDEKDNILQMINERFSDITKELNINFKIEEDIDKIKECRDYDYLISRGEYLMAKILSFYLKIPFIDSKDCIYINEDGTADILKSKQMAKNALKAYTCAVVPGFYGINNGKIKTFTRGGSDISGAILSFILNADVYENFTDVNGFLQADPRVVNNDNIVEQLSYKETRELSHMGADVLHEESVNPIILANGMINIKNTNNPKYCGTVISSKTDYNTNKMAARTGINLCMCDEYFNRSEHIIGNYALIYGLTSKYSLFVVITRYINLKIKIINTLREQCIKVFYLSLTDFNTLYIGVINNYKKAYKAIFDIIKK